MEQEGDEEGDTVFGIVFGLAFASWRSVAYNVVESIKRFYYIQRWIKKKRGYWRAASLVSYNGLMF